MVKLLGTHVVVLYVSRLLLIWAKCVSMSKHLQRVVHLSITQRPQAMSSAFKHSKDWDWTVFVHEPRVLLVWVSLWCFLRTGWPYWSGYPLPYRLAWNTSLVVKFLISWKCCFQDTRRFSRMPMIHTRVVDPVLTTRAIVQEHRLPTVRCHMEALSATEIKVSVLASSDSELMLNTNTV